MEARNRRVISWNGPKGSQLMPVVVLAFALVAAAIFVSILFSTRTTSPAIRAGNALSLQHQQAPDAIERNDIYSAAIAARAHQSADSVDRNAQLSYGQMLVRFNDLSPDAQERNIALSGG